MRIHSFIKVCIAALTIAFAVSMGTVPVSAQTQPPVSVSTVTQVRLTCVSTDLSDMWCLTYDKIAPNRWVQRAKNGKTFQFVEFGIQNNGRSLLLRDASRNIVVNFNFGSMVSDAVMMVGGLRRQVFGTITGVYEVSSNSSPDTCTQQATAGVKCTCDLRTLRPLQGAVGMEEVRKKMEDIVDKDIIVTGKKTRLDLAYDPIKTTRGVNGLFYVTDHHHGALAWLKAGHTMGTCMLQFGGIPTDWTRFWTELKELKLVRLADKDGRTITEADLPKTLSALPDDPYRSLAWRVRKGEKGKENDAGFCRGLMTENKEFAEFQWADWLRTRITPAPAEGQDWRKRKREEAIALAKTPAASGLPGYRRDLSVPCPADPD